MIPAKSELLPTYTLQPVQEAAPVGPLPRRRLRAILPLLTGLGAALLLPWTGLFEDVAVLLLGGLGAAAVWSADARSPRDAWQRAFPGVSTRGVTMLPRELTGVRALARVCAEVQGALQALDEAPRRGWRSALAARRSRRALQALPAHAAAIAVQLERVAAIGDPRVEGRRRRLADELEAILPLARRMRTAALREDVAQDEAGEALRALDHHERGWSAELDCADELDALEAQLERFPA